MILKNKNKIIYQFIENRHFFPTSIVFVCVFTNFLLSLFVCFIFSYSPLTLDQLDSMIYLGINYITTFIKTFKKKKNELCKIDQSRDIKSWIHFVKPPHLLSSILKQRTRMVNPPPRHVRSIHFGTHWHAWCCIS